MIKAKKPKLSNKQKLNMMVGMYKYAFESNILNIDLSAYHKASIKRSLKLKIRINKFEDTYIKLKNKISTNIAPAKEEVFESERVNVNFTINLDQGNRDNDYHYDLYDKYSFANLEYY